MGGGPTASGIRRQTKARVPGIDDAKFRAIADDAKQNCPVSKAPSAVPITLEAELLGVSRLKPLLHEWARRRIAAPAVRRHSDAIPHGAARMRRITWIATLCCLAATAQAAAVHLLTAAPIHTSAPAQPQAAATAWDESRPLPSGGAAKTLPGHYPDAPPV